LFYKLYKAFDIKEEVEMPTLLNVNVISERDIISTILLLVYGTVHYLNSEQSLMFTVYWLVTEKDFYFKPGCCNYFLIGITIEDMIHRLYAFKI